MRNWQKNESFNTIIERLLNVNEEYEELNDLIGGEQEIARGEYEVYKSSKDYLTVLKNKIIVKIT